MLSVVAESGAAVRPQKDYGALSTSHRAAKIDAPSAHGGRESEGGGHAGPVDLKPGPPSASVPARSALSHSVRDRGDVRAARAAAWSAAPAWVYHAGRIAKESRGTGAR